MGDNLQILRDEISTYIYKLIFLPIFDFKSLVFLHHLLVLHVAVVVVISRLAGCSRTAVPQSDPTRRNRRLSSEIVNRRWQMRWSVPGCRPESSKVHRLELPLSGERKKKLSIYSVLWWLVTWRWGDGWCSGKKQSNDKWCMYHYQFHVSDLMCGHVGILKYTWRWLRAWAATWS